MRKHFVTVLLAIFAAVACAAPALADDTQPIYLLFVNTAAQAFQVKGITLGGKPCAGCTDRTVAPGATVLVKIGMLGSNHLKFSVTGSGTCNYDISSVDRSRLGDCGSSPKIADDFDAHSDMMFDSKGTPTFELIYAYVPPTGK
jgi:hypothetical protein